jgi:CPA2 family monovalent cation:H+ antiporter-2
VVHVVPPHQSFGQHARERAVLFAKLRHTAAQADVKVTTRVDHGDPAEIILWHARSLRPDVIVMGTRRRDGIRRFRVGSVAKRVTVKSRIPVLVVPSQRHTSATRPFSHLAVAVDFTAASERAIEKALALASGPTDRITLLHVVPGFSSGVPPHLYRYGIREYQDHLTRDARRRLERVVAAMRHTAPAVHARILVGDPTTELSHAVEGIGADLLIVGVSKRSLISRALFGTTAARLLKVSHLPLLTVPPVGTPIARQKSASVQLAA